MKIVSDLEKNAHLFVEFLKWKLGEQFNPEHKIEIAMRVVDAWFKSEGIETRIGNRQLVDKIRVYEAEIRKWSNLHPNSGFVWSEKKSIIYLVGDKMFFELHQTLTILNKKPTYETVIWLNGQEDATHPVEAKVLADKLITLFDGALVDTSKNNCNNGHIVRCVTALFPRNVNVKSILMQYSTVRAQHNVELEQVCASYCRYLVHKKGEKGKNISSLNRFMKSEEWTDNWSIIDSIQVELAPDEAWGALDVMAKDLGLKSNQAFSPPIYNPHWYWHGWKDGLMPLP